VIVPSKPTQGTRYTLGIVNELAGLCGTAALYRAKTSPPAIGTRKEDESRYTSAHSSLLNAIEDFVGWRPNVVQPIAFTHKEHIANQVECATCHEGVNHGALAGLPSLRLCMRCHEFFAKDRPEVKKFTLIFESGHDVSWQRVYGFSPTSHVKFNHAPHIQARLSCKTCHGDLASMTVAVRAVNMNMGFCLSCHRAKRASTDCVSCHY
jgi:hypothetical protein